MLSTSPGNPSSTDLRSRTLADVDVEKEKQRLQSIPPSSNGSVFPLMSFPFPGFPMRNLSSSPAALPSTTCGSGFSTSLPFNFPFHQLMLMQQWTAKGANNSSLLNDSNGSLATDSRASSTSSPSNRSLELDNDGNAMCPVCKEKLGPETDWETHLRFERNNLIQLLEGIQSRKFQASDSKLLPDDAVQCGSKKRNRFEDLKRVQENQRKRLAVNKGIHISINRDAKLSVTNFSTDLNGHHSGSPFLRDNDSNCKTCQQQYDHYVVDSRNLDELRCEKCFHEYRQQICALPSTITGSVDDLTEGAGIAFGQNSDDDYEVPEKRIKAEF